MGKAGKPALTVESHKGLHSSKLQPSTGVEVTDSDKTLAYYGRKESFDTTLLSLVKVRCRIDWAVSID